MADRTLNIYMNNLVVYVHRIAFTTFSMESSYNLLFCIHWQVLFLYSIDFLESSSGSERPFQLSLHIESIGKVVFFL